MLAYPPLEVLRFGIVAVVQSASDSAHYPAFNQGTYDQLAIPWLRLQFFDETELDWLLAEPLERRLAAVVSRPVPYPCPPSGKPWDAAPKRLPTP